MKLKIVVSTLMMMATGICNAGMIDIGSCDPYNGKASVVITVSSGKWVGFSARTSSGEIIDVPPVKKSQFGLIGIGTGSHWFSFGANKGVIEVRASTWKGYNRRTNLMEGRLDDTGWVRCH